MEPDFSGWVTKANLVCTDGRTIMPDAFKHQDQVTVPLVWQHDIKTPENILGHVVLTHKAPEGVWGDAYFNDTPSAGHSKTMVKHKDIKHMSIRANRLVEKMKKVYDGMIQEVSLVVSGANPGALIQQVSLEHMDGSVEDLDEVIIHTGFEFELRHLSEELDNAENEDNEDNSAEHADDDTSGQEVWDSMDEDQKGLVHYMIKQALLKAKAGDSNTEHSENTNTEDTLDHKEGNTDMSRNLFDQDKGGSQAGAEGLTLTHEQVGNIMQAAQRMGSLRQAAEQYAEAELEHGINDIEILFPEARNVTQTPEWEKRRTEWVSKVLGAVTKKPFSRIKSVVADITMEEARAKGYIKGNLKKEEWFGLKSRKTSPTTVYKKQKLDRDDILDITDFDVVVWMKGEMRLMTEEEIARAILVGDGRPVEDPENPGEPNPDKIADPAGATSGDGIRSILNDHELYVTRVPVEYDDTTTDYRPAVEAIMLGMEFFEGTGTPTLYTTKGRLNRMLLSKDTLNRRLWRTKADLAAELGVDDIVEVPILTEHPDVLGIIVNLTDYAVGTDRGGEMTFFEDFDIDFNQHKYLYETRLSGALTKIKSALVITREDISENPVTPDLLAFDPETNTIDFVAQTGVVYSLTPGGTALAADEVITEDTIVYMRPDSGYYFTAGSPTEELYEFNPDA